MDPVLMRGSRWLQGELHYEIAEVERCLAEGLHESRPVPLRRSIQALEILDKVAAFAAGWNGPACWLLLINL
jgi:hypothetical protein